MTEREVKLIERVANILNKSETDIKYTSLMKTIEELVEVIENGIPNA